MKNVLSTIYHYNRSLIIILLLLLGNNAFCGNSIRDPDQKKSLTMNLGETVTIDPLDDWERTTSDFWGIRSAGYTISDKSAFTVTMKEEKTTYTAGQNNWEQGYYYIFSLKALKAGTYTLDTWLSYTGKFIGMYGDHNINTVHIIYTITVVVPVTSVTLNKTNAEIGVSETLQLTATVKPSNATNKNLSWKSSDTSVATVSSSGLVKGLKAGSCTITATSKDGTKKSASCYLKVKNIMVSSVTLNKSSAQMYIGDNLQLTATISPSNATNKELTWSSSNSSVASVNSSTGLVTAKKAGTCTIKASTKDGSGKNATCTVTVNNILVNSITLNKTTASLIAGSSLQLSATITPSNATNKSLEWSTSNSNVATVSSSGLVTGKNDGTCTITAKAKDGSGVYATCSVSVKYIYMSSISLGYTMANIFVGEPLQLLANFKPTNTSNKNLTWSSSDNNIASVSNSGVVTGLKVGTCIIQAKANDGTGISVSCTINVINDATKNSGDINGDGETSISDVFLLVDAILNTVPQNVEANLYDINGDADITIADVTLLIDKILTNKEDIGENIFKERVINGNCESSNVSCFKTNEKITKIIEDPINKDNHCIAMKIPECDLPDFDEFYITVPDKMEAGDKYRLKFRIRAEKATTVRITAYNFPDKINYWYNVMDDINIGENWQAIELEGIVTEEYINRGSNYDGMDNEFHTIAIGIYKLDYSENICYFDDISWQVKKSWFNYVKNGDLSTDDVSCFIGRDGIDGIDSPARIVKLEDGTRAFNVTSKAPTIDLQTGEIEQIDSWRTQFFITTPHVLRENEKYKFVMEARAEKSATVISGLHRSAGDHLSEMFGNFDLSNEWKKIEFEGTVTAKQAGGYTIAFNCNTLKDINNYYFRNIEFYINDYDVKE